MRSPLRLLALTALLALAPAADAAVKNGRYDGKVAAGYGAPQFTITLKGGKATKLVARMFTMCNGGPQQQWVVAPSKSFKVDAGGRFSGKVTESIGGVASETVWIKGRFSASKVTGTIRSQTVGSGETCDTFERKFAAARR